jgi:hypothetical protein
MPQLLSTEVAALVIASAWVGEVVGGPAASAMSSVTICCRSCTNCERSSGVVLAPARSARATARLAWRTAVCMALIVPGRCPASSLSASARSSVKRIRRVSTFMRQMSSGITVSG